MLLVNERGLKQTENSARPFGDAYVEFGYFPLVCSCSPKTRRVDFGQNRASERLDETGPVIKMMERVSDKQPKFTGFQEGAQL